MKSKCSDVDFYKKYSVFKDKNGQSYKIYITGQVDYTNEKTGRICVVCENQTTGEMKIVGTFSDSKDGGYVFALGNDYVE